MHSSRFLEMAVWNPPDRMVCQRWLSPPHIRLWTDGLRMTFVDSLYYQDQREALLEKICHAMDSSAIFIAMAFRNGLPRPMIHNSIAVGTQTSTTHSQSPIFRRYQYFPLRSVLQCLMSARHLSIIALYCHVVMNFANSDSR
jgi:hypothetical protein